MKKIVVLLLTAVMLLSLTACGGGNDNTPPSNTDKPTNSDTGSKEDEGEVKSVITQYGSNPDYEPYTATIYCPEGAYFDEDEYAEFQADGYINVKYVIYAPTLVLESLPGVTGEMQAGSGKLSPHVVGCVPNFV